MGGTREPPIAVPKGFSGSTEDWCKALGRKRLGKNLPRKRAKAPVPAPILHSSQEPVRVHKY